jgi:phosphate transport system protein
MSTTIRGPEGVYQSALTDYLVSMARMVEGSVNRALEALLHLDEQLAGEVFLTEPRVNEMEMLIDEHAIRLLRTGTLPDENLRLIVATIKINNDLERMGDLAVNIGQRVISLSLIPGAKTPPEIEPMTEAVRAMVGKSLGALTFRNVVLANEVLESDDAVDQLRDQIFDGLLAGMKRRPSQVASNVQFALAVRSLERISDHTTNIAEDILFWLRGLDVRHGRALQTPVEPADTDPIL